MCGASLLDGRHVVTAAHCFKLVGEGVGIVVGGLLVLWGVGVWVCCENGVILQRNSSVFF